MYKRTFKVKANRDAYARELKARGIKVRVWSMRNQLLDCHYVADEEPELRVDRGLANQRNFYPALYMVGEASW